MVEAKFTGWGLATKETSLHYDILNLTDHLIENSYFKRNIYIPFEVFFFSIFFFF